MRLTKQLVKSVLTKVLVHKSGKVVRVKRDETGCEDAIILCKNYKMTSTAAKM